MHASSARPNFLVACDVRDVCVAREALDIATAMHASAGNELEGNAVLYVALGAAVDACKSALLDAYVAVGAAARTMSEDEFLNHCEVLPLRVPELCSILDVARAMSAPLFGATV